MTVIGRRVIVDGIESSYRYDDFDENVHVRRIFQIIPDFGDHGKNGECDCHSLYPPEVYPTGIRWSDLKREIYGQALSA